MRQYYELKEQVGDALLFFRMGDFYELFDEDATLVAPLLSIVLTAREKGDRTKVPFCGVPHHSYQHYMMKLLRLGYKVALAEQFTPTDSSSRSSSSPSLMSRRVVRIHTPGCTDDAESLLREGPLYLAAAYECPESHHWILALCEYSTGELRLGTTPHIEALKEQLALAEPRELLLRRFQMPLFENFAAHHLRSELPLLLSALPEEALKNASFSSQWQHLLLHSQNISPEEKTLLSALEAYLLSLHAPTHHILTVRGLTEAGTMKLSNVVVRDLELLRSLSQGSEKGSLWHVIHHSLTAMGSRQLRHRLLHPWARREDIERSHQIIELLLAAKGQLMLELRTALKGAADLERLAGRTLHGASLTPPQASLIRECLSKAESIHHILASSNTTEDSSGAARFLQHISQTCYKAQSLRTHLDEVLDAEVGTLGQDAVIRAGYHDTYDKACQQTQKAQEHLRCYEEQLRQRYNIPSLKVRQHKTYGLLLEVTKSHTHKVGEEFQLKQTMVNALRYTTDELQQRAQDLSQAEEVAQELEQQIYRQQVLDYLARHQKTLTDIAQALGQCDVSCCLAYLAYAQSYVRPVVNEGERILIRGGLHPVVADALPAHQYVASSIEMNSNQRQMLITGPNMGGKSTVMRQVALTALLSQMGSYVPCEHAELPLFDALFTRIGASDDLAGGRSTFMVEMSEAAHILRRSTSSSLVILDELGRGTSTEDGVALACSVLHEFAENIHSWVLFATHYHELAALSSTLSSVRLWQTEVLAQKGTMVFTYRLKEGVCSHSFGLATAERAGIPHSVLQRARNYLATHAPRESSSPHSTTLPATTTAPEQAFEMWQELKKLDTTALSPLAALHLVLQWQEKAQQEPSSASVARRSPPPPAHSASEQSSL